MARIESKTKYELKGAIIQLAVHSVSEPRGELVTKAMGRFVNDVM